MEGALVGGLVAQKKRQAFGVHAFAREALVLEAKGALGEPLGLDHLFYKDVFGRVGGLVLVEESGLEGGERGGIFARDEEDAAGEAVFRGITRRSQFAHGGARAGGVLGVAAIGEGAGCGGDGFVVVKNEAKRLGWVDDALVIGVREIGKARAGGCGGERAASFFAGSALGGGCVVRGWS
jgi:hypothetical protein